MTYLFLLSQEHPDLPRAEVEAVLDAEGVEYAVKEQHDTLLIVEADAVAGVERLAMTFEAAELLHTFPPDQYQKLATKDVAAENAFAVRATAIDDTGYPEELERNVGRIIDKNSDAAVDLDAPDELFRIYLHGGTAYLCRVTHPVDRSVFETRRNQYRPFSKPIALHPRLARTLVNLSGVTSEDAVLDPFCGTGGILIEAALVGCDIFGLDIQQEMVDGTEENLADTGVSGDIRQGSIADTPTIFARMFDAIVTDLPYGKASKREDTPTETFLDVAADMTDGRVVFMSNDPDLTDHGPDFEIFVHRSLSRYVYLLD